MHPSTILRLVAALPEPQISAAPEGSGSMTSRCGSKGQVYGTVLVDMDTGDAVDLHVQALADTQQGAAFIALCADFGRDRTRCSTTSTTWTGRTLRL